MADTTSSGTSIVTLLVSYWWLALIFGGAVLEWIGETFGMGLSALRRAAMARRKHQLKMRRLELQIAQARSATAADALSLPTPGPCVHRRVRQVRDRTDELVGWLCVGCDEQLPADWAVAKEDL